MHTQEKLNVSKFKKNGGGAEEMAHCVKALAAKPELVVLEPLGRRREPSHASRITSHALSK